MYSLFNIVVYLTYRWLWKPSKPTDCGALNWYNTARNCILYRLKRWKIEFHLPRHVMQLLYLAMDFHTVDNSLSDMMNHLVLNYQVFR